MIQRSRSRHRGRTPKNETFTYRSISICGSTRAREPKRGQCRRAVDTAFCVAADHAGDTRCSVSRISIDLAIDNESRSETKRKRYRCRLPAKRTQFHQSATLHRLSSVKGKVNPTFWKMEATRGKGGPRRGGPEGSNSKLKFEGGEQLALDHRVIIV